MRLLAFVGNRRVMALIGTLSVGLVGVSCSQAPDHPAATESLRYSYFTKSDLVVMDGTREVARQKVAYMKKYWGAVWTLDAKYLAVVVDKQQGAEGGQVRRLLVIEAASGKSREVACPDCTTVAPVGGSKVIISVTGEGDYLDSMLRFDLNDALPPVRLPDLNTPGHRMEVKVPVLVSGVDGKALMTGVDEDGRTVYYVYNADGTSSPAGADSYGETPYRSFESGAVTQTSDGGLMFGISIAGRSSQDGCEASAVVTVRKAGDDSPQFFNLTAQLLPKNRSAGYDAITSALDMWWEKSGELHAVLSSATCDNGKRNESSAPAEWRAEGDHWVKVSDAPVIAARPTGSGKILLVNDSSVKDGYALKLDADGKQTIIANDAVSISAPPVAAVERVKSYSVSTPTTTPSVSVPSTSTPATSSPLPTDELSGNPGDRIMIDRLSISLKPGWKAGNGFITDTSTCFGNNICLKLEIASAETIRDWSEEKQLDHPPCVDYSTSGLKMLAPPGDAPVFKGTKDVGGVMARYYEMQLCPDGKPKSTVRYWLFKDKRALLFVLESNDRVFRGLDEALAQATWAK